MCLDSSCCVVSLFPPYHIYVRWWVEIDELNVYIFQLQQDNENLKQRVAYLEKERQTEKDNVASANAHAIENDQYARRNNMVVLGINEQEKNPAEAKRKIIKEKIKISLKADDIETCHRLGKKMWIRIGQYLSVSVIGM